MEATGGGPIPMVVVYLGKHFGGWTFHRDDLRRVAR
jgi:hypothetical protein